MRVFFVQYTQQYNINHNTVIIKTHCENYVTNVNQWSRYYDLLYCCTFLERDY